MSRKSETSRSIKLVEDLLEIVIRELKELESDAQDLITFRRFEKSTKMITDMTLIEAQTEDIATIVEDILSELEVE